MFIHLIRVAVCSITRVDGCFYNNVMKTTQQRHEDNGQKDHTERAHQHECCLFEHLRIHAFPMLAGVNGLYIVIVSVIVDIHGVFLPPGRPLQLLPGPFSPTHNRRSVCRTLLLIRLRTGCPVWLLLRDLPAAFRAKRGGAPKREAPQ